jgi:hypothetical protein
MADGELRYLESLEASGARGSTDGLALYRCIGSTLDAVEGDYLALLPVQGRRAEDGTRRSRSTPLLAADVLGAAVRLERCRPPARAGFAAFSTARTGHAPVTAMVAVSSLYPEADAFAALSAGAQPRFNRWYNRHIPAVLALGFFHTGYRYLAVEPEADGTRRHWAFYETDVGDPRSVLPAYLARRRQEARATPGFIPPHIRVLGSSWYEAIRR